MVKRKALDEDKTVEAYVRHKEAQRQEKNKRRREAYARQKASKIKQQQGNLVPEPNGQDRICEVQLNVPGEKSAARNTAVETLSPTETKREERNRKKREAYARKKQLSISDQGESAVISQCKRSTIRQKSQPPDGTNGNLTIEEEQKNKRNKRRRELYAQKKQISIYERKAIVTCAAITLPTNISDKGKAQVSWLSIYEIGSSSSRTSRQENRKRSNNKIAGKEPKCRKLVAPGEAMVLPPQPPYQHCHATRFYLEPEGFCCRKGQISLVSVSTPPELWHLYTSDSIETDEFRTYIRTYNSSFAFTSFGVKKYDKKLCQRDKGIYTVRIQGQVYHYINELEPSSNNLDPSSNKLSHLQLYFYDTDHEVENRLRFSEKLRASIVKKLIRILEPNPYAIFFRSLSNINELDTHQIRIRCDSGLDQRVYNLPSVSQVAAIWIDNDGSTEHTERVITVHRTSSQSERIHYSFGCYDALQYPLLFPLGETGWHFGIKRVEKRKGEQSCRGQFIVSPKSVQPTVDIIDAENEVMSKRRKERATVSCREYYCYRLQIRPKEASILLHSGRLLQQFCIDMYVKVETSRLQFFRNNQSQIRADYYQGIVDSVSAGENRGSKIGHRVILPPSFIGGPRDLRRRYIDAMAIVQQFGKPDVFLTMTCNASWPEIKEHLGPKDEAQNRPDLVVRVFRAKMEELKHDLIKRQVFGKVAAFVYVIEFQKRGLPHMHLLLILERGHKLLSPESYDKIVRAELPCEEENPHLRATVVKHMIHGPCGDLKPSNVCMKTGKCRNHYPKDFEPITRCKKDSYPVYKREDTKEKIMIRGHLLDNRWVVPYNAYLLAKFNCHLNVEICSTIKAVKYLYKYIYKGHDKVAFHVTQQNDQEDIDEISRFQNARWISAPEAVWRLYGLPMFGMYPSVYHLQIHLENQQSVNFKESDNLNSILRNDMFSKTMLTEFFAMNETHEKAKAGKFLYKEFPEYFVWLLGERRWKEREQDKVIGRVVTIQPTQGEIYFLRLLLNNVRGPTSFSDLRTINGKKVKTFREAALMLGLLEEDNDVEQCLKEAATYQMPYAMRRLFASILVNCALNNPRQLWQKFQDPMSEDFAKNKNLSKQEIHRKVLQGVGSILRSMGKNIKDFKLCPDEFIYPDDDKIAKEIEEELNLVVSEADYQTISMLTAEQRIAFDKITERVFSNQCGSFFIDGPGGTGKTFLYKAILAAVRSRHYVALATASSGVAGSILPGGRTAHSRFKIPIDGDDYKPCNVGKQSGLAKLLRMAKLIIWDEAPLAKRQNIEALDEMLKDVNDSDLPFGGKVVVFGGDFRQIPPVVSKGSKTESIAASLVNSHLWNSFEKLRLTENMRARSDPSFCEYLLRIGNGIEPTDSQHRVCLPPSMIVPLKKESRQTNCPEELINEIFPDLSKYAQDPLSMLNTVILSPKNDSINEINNFLIEKFPGTKENNTMREYTSIDKTVDEAYQADYEDFMNSLSPNGLPPHKLIVKKNCPIILLRNIYPSQGHCNGTRLICRDFKDHVICAEIAVGDHKGEILFLHRIPLRSSDHEKFPVEFTRSQFPIKLCFAMTINKAQGQTLEKVGIYLREPVFSHGHLYVALSRATTAAAVKILIEPTNEDDTQNNRTKNVVYEELLKLAALC